ncbi:Protein TolQ [Nitrospina gracilis 3/211]|uniref:Protein TolQ n=1 Tax=Nitrospina gracilis (strain 3/211) TaxID=1266370 RepID=M1YYQ8_NITG3|nr:MULTISPECIES: protein TolQ [Nitrospina]MCF8723544.1 biopolymer transport protein TolQ [Nitrospina sp. Nb-3]CCQ90616.1 Protein TolQ [Nitrospina gracilis 3/211]
METLNPSTMPLSIFEMVSRSSTMAKAVLVLLLIFSIVSWAIILTKFIAYRKAKQEDQSFLRVFSQSSSLVNIYNFSQKLKYSPVARVFLTGYSELYRYSGSNDQGREAGMTREVALSEQDLKGIGLSLTKAINHEIERLAHRLDFLATTGSTTPFIGLFGTVWGIMHSFRMIGVKGSASIGGVAPGIAEALIATAAGLFAAIPAVVFYNYLNAKIRGFTARMDDFSRDFLFMSEKDFLRKPVDY